MNFADLGIESDIVAVLAEHGITTPFPIQEQTIPLALKGQDIIGQAKTGTGKTLGFGLPLLQRLGENPEPGVQAVVVTPTRELAMQVYEDLVTAASRRGTSLVAIYGGKAYDEQIDQLKAGAQVVVGTPGRIIDLMNQRVLSLSNVREIVLDEADKMLDLGFLPDIEKIFSRVPAVRHTMLFSATMPGPILTLARRFMSAPVHIRVTDPDEGVLQKNIRHLVYRAHPLDKDELIARALQATGRGKTVIFMRTKRAAAKLLDELRERGFSACAVHGDMNQDQRERSMEQFRSGKRDVLIATDVAARGIDVDDVTHVINHTIPEDEKTYLHRVGRTGRAGNTGIAITLVDWEDLPRWAIISRALELDAEDPAETYSSSPHLFSDLDIPEGTKGRIKQPAAQPGSRSRTRNRRRTGGSKQGAGAAGEKQQSGGDGAATGESAAPRRRRRRRRTNSQSTAAQQRDQAPKADGAAGA